MDINITKIRTKDGRWGRPTTVSMSQVADYMRSKTLQAIAERLARRISRSKAGGDSIQTSIRNTAARLPYLIFSATFSGKGLYDLKQPTGLMLLSIDTGNDPQQAYQLRQCVNQLPQTVMSFTGSSRHTLKVVVRCLLPNGSVPTEADKYETFLSAAQEQAAKFYAAYTGCSIRLVKQSLTRGCRMTQDDRLYYNPEALPLTVIASHGLNSYIHARTDEDGNIRRETDEAVARQQQTEFYACLSSVLEDIQADGSAANTEKILVRVAELCHKAGLDEEASVGRTVNYRKWGVGEQTIRKIFRTAYARPLGGMPASQMSAKEQIARKVEEFFERRYELRHNVMKDCEEFRPRSSDYAPWQLLTAREIRRIAHEQMLDAGAAWPIDIENYARSAVVRSYNPIHEFLAGCGRWDQHTDYIGRLADRVPNRHPLWKQLFHRWFLGMVAAWLGYSRDFSNAVVPMLIGKQGCRKSTFCKQILPRSLREYYIDDVKMDNAEQVERMLGRMALVNIDEYNAKTNREQAKIKRILTERDVQVRRMRDSNYSLTQRMASFIATTNDRQPLTDRTGSRRYLCVEVTGNIDTETPINYQQLYAQAVHEIENGEQYYPTKEEEEKMVSYNSQFVSTTTCELLLETYFRPAKRHKDNFMKAVDILTQLQKKVRGSDRPNMKQLTSALKAAHYEYGAIHGIRGWYAEKVND